MQPSLSKAKIEIAQVNEPKLTTRKKSQQMIKLIYGLNSKKHHSLSKRSVHTVCSNIMFMISSLAPKV